MKAKEIGERLRSARESAGLTVVEAAKRLGFPSYQTLSKIEAGEREVRASELPLFSKAYFCSISYLLGEQPSRPAGFLLWRKAPEGRKKKEVESRVFNLCQQYQLLEKLLGFPEPEGFSFPLSARNKEAICSHWQIDEIAENAGKILALGKRPSCGLARVLEQDYGIKLFYIPLSHVGSAASMIHEDWGAVVVVNSDESPWRRNYDLAHELFHLITWDAISDKDLKDENVFGDLEKKAERFASSLLLPEREIRRELSERFETERTIKYSDLVDIARGFGVSTQALLYRLANLGLLKWEKADELANDEDLARLDKKARRGDWGDKPSPERFYSLAIRCLRKGLISRGKFAELVEIDRSEIDDFIEGFGLMEAEGEPLEIMAP